MLDVKNVKVDLDLGENSILLYRFVRGSHSHGTATETSDIDTMSVYINPQDKLLGFTDKDDFYVSDEKNDNVAYELGRYLELLVKANPTMLESLYVSDDCVIYKHPVMDKIFKMRDKFLCKDALKSFTSYALEQIRKARGYNKLCAYPEDMERKQPIDFCFTFKGQGTTQITEWLDEHGLKQIYCGLNHLPNMNQMYGLFYDWGQHIHMEWKTPEEFADFMYNASYWSEENKQENMAAKPFIYSIQTYNPELWQTIKPWKLHEIPGCDHFSQAQEWNRKRWIKLYHEITPNGYHGIQKESGKSNDVHLDSIKKGDTPLCWLHYNKDGYQSHCKLYKNWSDWKRLRNEVRYKSNFGQGYDAKNMSEVVRLLSMGCELAEGKGFVVDRRIAGDREYLLDIKKHKYTYEELIEVGNKLETRLNEAIKTCTLPEHVDEEMANKLLIEMRKELYKKHKKQ